jgi:outer membrane protein OmpA-like peptidoglycan-associated protein
MKRLAIFAVVFVAAACAAKTRPSALNDAQTIYRMLITNGAESRVEGPVIRTRDAIKTAEEAFEQNRDLRYQEGLANVAKRFALAAEAENQRVLAERATDSLTKARLQRLVTLSEAQRAAMMRAQQLSQSEIDSLRARNMLVSQQADSLRRAAEAASARLNEALTQLRSLVSEITNLRETPRGVVISLSDILFETGKSRLRPGAESNVRQISAILNQYPDYRISVEGHTDSRGSDALNDKLSQERASSVRNALVAGGVTPDRITSVGFGEKQPVADNNTEAGRQQNRRVEVIVLGAGTVADAARRDSTARSDSTPRP